MNTLSSPWASKPFATSCTCTLSPGESSRSSAPSIDASPNSLTTMARRRFFVSLSRFDSKVVLPAPKKPVTMVIGSGSWIMLRRKRLLVGKMDSCKVLSDARINNGGAANRNKRNTQRVRRARFCGIAAGVAGRLAHNAIDAQVAPKRFVQCLRELPLHRDETVALHPKLQGALQLHRVGRQTQIPCTVGRMRMLDKTRQIIDTHRKKNTAARRNRCLSGGLNAIVLLRGRIGVRIRALIAEIVQVQFTRKLDQLMRDLQRIGMRRIDEQPRA